MLAARLTVVQVLDSFAVSCEITEFSPGQDPEHFSQKPITILLEDGWEKEDSLHTVKSLLALWSEMTNSK